MNRALLILLTFAIVSTDVFCQLFEKLTGWDWWSKLPALVGAFLFSITVGASVAHILLSLLAGTNMRKDIVQVDPVEEFVG
jgi:hypothetical protein